VPDQPYPSRNAAGDFKFEGRKDTALKPPAA
jgi:hypothetical protein